MPRGGKRDGAGRKAGSLTTRTRELVEKARDAGLTPLDYMLSVMRDESFDMEKRLEAAKAAAPYMHPRLAAIEHTGADGGPIQIVTKAQRDAAVAAALRVDS